MTTLHNTGALTGRILLAALFIPAGISKIVGFEGTVGYIPPWVCHWRLWLQSPLLWLNSLPDWPCW